MKKGAFLFAYINYFFILYNTGRIRAEALHEKSGLTYTLIKTEKINVYVN